ncbi:hypothetical protein B9S64_21525 [Streptomyces sp. SM18]|nr:hypothetical protein B9S64_21525 [Streptomyces sp. SM18]
MPLNSAEVGRATGPDPAEASGAALVTGGLPLICAEWPRHRVVSWWRHSVPGGARWCHEVPGWCLVWRSVVSVVPCPWCDPGGVCAGQVVRVGCLVVAASMRWLQVAP